MALMSWIVPRMFEACVHVTNLVLSERSSFKSKARSLGFSFVFGTHHLRISFCRVAKDTHDAIFASWSTLEMMISEPSGKSRANERLRNSWVVDDPRTRLLLEGLE